MKKTTEYSNRWARPACAAAGLLALACSSLPSWQRAPHDVLYQRAPQPRLHPAVAEIETSEWLPSFWSGSFQQIGRGISPGWHLEQSTGGLPALDVNAFGKVPDSTWFENRIGRRRMSVNEIRRGPNRHPRPARGKLIVKKGKTEGATPGVVVEDSAEALWIVKFDPPAFPELTSAAEVVSTKLLYAAGYHVPENHIVHFHLDDLEVSPKATMRDRYNRKVPFGVADLKNAVAQLNPGPNGMVRAMFSRFLPGRPVGPFPPTGTRLDDPNDRIPHERRRSLRGLAMFYAWINNTDAKYTNTLDMFVERDEKTGAGFLMHYLIDFGTSLGGGPGGPKSMYEGYEYIVDWQYVGQRFATLGIDYPYWATVRRAPYRAVGHYEARVFDPARWRPKYPNPGLDAASSRDVFWAASILAHFRVVDIAAAVSAGEYTEPGAAELITAVLLARRNKILAHAFEKLTPLDDPIVTRGRRLHLVDLEVLAGTRDQEEVEYRWSIAWHRDGAPDRTLSSTWSPRPTAHLGPVVAWLQKNEGARLARSPFLTMAWQRRVRGGRRWGPEVRVHLRLLADGTVIPVGLERDEA